MSRVARPRLIYRVLQVFKAERKAHKAQVDKQAKTVREAPALASHLSGAMPSTLTSISQIVVITTEKKR